MTGRYAQPQALRKALEVRLKSHSSDWQPVLQPDTANEGEWNSNIWTCRRHNPSRCRTDRKRCGP